MLSKFLADKKGLQNLIKYSAIVVDHLVKGRKPSNYEALEETELRESIYHILTSLGLEAQNPKNVAISSRGDTYKIYDYPFNKEKCFGMYRHSISLEVPKDYEFIELIEMVVSKVKEQTNVRLFR